MGDQTPDSSLLPLCPHWSWLLEGLGSSRALCLFCLILMAKAGHPASPGSRLGKWGLPPGRRSSNATLHQAWIQNREKNKEEHKRQMSSMALIFALFKSSQWASHLLFLSVKLCMSLDFVGICTLWRSLGKAVLYLIARCSPTQCVEASMRQQSAGLSDLGL